MAQETEPLRRFLEGKNSLVAIDIGANKGFWTRAFIESYGERVRHVYMIDASPENFRELTNRDDSLHLLYSDFAKCSAYHFAVGDKFGEVTLHTNEDGSPLASIIQRDFEYGFDSNAIQIKVSLDTIDNFVLRQNITHINVLKIDTEGNELPILLGAARCFKRKMVDVVLFEFGLHQLASRHIFQDFFKFFSSHGMSLYAIEESDVVPIPEYNHVYEVFTVCRNFIAVRRQP